MPTFKELKKIFITETFKVEQNEVPKVLKELRNKYMKDIIKFKGREKRFFIEDDNFF